MSYDRAIGQHLVDQGLLRLDHLAKALSSQAVLGGRVGTCLLEMDAVTEDQLLKALAAQTGAASVSAEDLRQVPADVVALVPSKLAEKLKVLPFRLSLGKLDVAMVDVFDLAAQDEIAFLTGKRITVHVSTEARLWEALDRYYKIECPSRFSHLLDRLNRARYLWTGTGPDSPAKTPVAPGRESRASMSGVFNLPPQEQLIRKPAQRQTSAPPSIPSAATARPIIPLTTAGAPAAAAQPVRKAVPRKPPPTTITLSAAERMALQGRKNISIPPVVPAAVPAAIPAPVEAKVTSFEEFADQLTLMADRDEVGRALLSFLGERFDRVALLMVRMGEIHGWMGNGPDFDESRLASFLIDFSQPSVFLNIKLGAPYYLGPMAPMAAHKEFLESWGGKQPRECLVLPVKIKKRIVTFLYIDSLGGSISGIDMEEMQKVTATVAGAFELCILRNKLKST